MLPKKGFLEKIYGHFLVKQPCISCLSLKKIFFAVILFIVVFTFLFDNSFGASSQLNLSNKQLKPSPVPESSVFAGGYNKVYQFINNHDYMFAPLSGAIAGGVKCGLWCAAAGGMAGIIDEVAVYFGYADRRYLSWGIFGGVTGHVIKPGTFSDMAGVAIGILLPTGILQKQKQTIYPMISEVAGNVVAGPWGSTIGGIAGVLDSVLVENRMSEQHYLTFGITGAAVATLLGWFNPIASSFVGAISGAIAAHYEEEIATSFLAPIKIADELYNTYSKFISKGQLDAHIERQAISLVGGQFLVQVLAMKMNGYQQSLSYNFERLDSAATPAWENFVSGITNVAIFIFPYAIGQLVSSTIDHYFAKKLEFTLEDKIRAELFSKESFLRLSQDRNATVLIDNLSADTAEIVGSGSSLITGAVSSSIEGAYGVGIVIVTSPNLFVYSALYDQACSFISNWLMSQRRVYFEEVKKLDSELISTFKHDSENIRTIAERDGVEATARKIRQVTNKIREQEGAQRLWGMVNSVWWTILTPDIF